MDSRHGKVRMKVEGDRLSNLPDDIIHKILSFNGIKHAIQTSALSSRWRYIWTSMPSLNFSSDDFNFEFVTHVLSGRNNEIDASSVNLSFDETVRQVLVKRIFYYAFSHNVQQLNITCLPGKEIEYPLYVFSSHSLKDLTLTRCTYEPTCELPGLTTLNLERVKLIDNKGAGLFANCANLKSLTLKKCTMMSLNDFNICHPGLCSLTLKDSNGVVNVVTPLLKDLTINRWPGLHKISAPNLSSLRYELEDDYCYGHNLLQFTADPLHLEKADICALCPYLEDEAYTQEIVCLLQQLHSVKFLMLSLEVVKLLCSYVELISHQPSPFTNLKSLKIYPHDAILPIATSMPTKVKNFLLDGSPGAIFTVLSDEEISAVQNVVSARNLMRSIEVQLDQLKENSETDTAGRKQDKVSTVRNMSWVLKMIKKLLTKVPTSERERLQARFSGLCAKADTMMVQMECDKKPSCSNFFFHEFATSSNSSS